MPFAVKGDEAATAVVRLRMTRAEKQRLRDDAELAGLTMSELIRRRTFGRTVIASADLATVNELRRLGGLLKLAHNESRGAYSEATAAAIVALRAAIERVASGWVSRL